MLLLRPSREFLARLMLSGVEVDSFARDVARNSCAVIRFAKAGVAAGDGVVALSYRVGE
jgi:hypothetical protein